MISQNLKDTLQNHNKFLTLSLSITLQKKCIEEFLRLGISAESLSFLVVGLQKISNELEEGVKYVKINEDFNDITKDFNDKNN